VKDATSAALLHGYISNLAEAVSLSTWWTQFDYGNLTSP